MSEKKVLHNMMEDIMLEKIDEVLANYNCCKCDDCKMDMLAYALNKAKPTYVATHKGGIFSKLDSLELQKEVDLISIAVRSIEIISKNPHHEK